MVLAAALVGRADLPRRFTGQTFLCLSLASCDSGTYGDRHHRSVDFASMTNLASLADFALLEVALTLPSLTEVALAVLTTPFTLSSPLEVLQGGSSSASLLMTPYGMTRQKLCFSCLVGGESYILFSFLTTESELIVLWKFL
jgi:hypothetical protein